MSAAQVLLSRCEKVRQVRTRGNFTASFDCCCPAHDDRSPSMNVDVTADGRVLVICRAECSIGDIVASVGLKLADLFPPRVNDDKRRPEAAPRARPVEIHESLNAAGCKLFADSVELAGTIGEVYLRQVRRCPLPPADGDLRFHPRAYHWIERRNLPALVARLSDALTGQARSLHFTFLQADGSGKAPIGKPRLLLAGHHKLGAICRLWPDEAVTTGLGIGEGIESSLSLAHAFRPVWAAIDAGNLAALPPLAGVQSLTVAADHDQAGMDAAETCAACWTDAGRQVRLVLPEAPGTDLNDIAREAA